MAQTLRPVQRYLGRRAIPRCQCSQYSPLLASATTASPPHRRSYHASNSQPKFPYNPTETAILSSALTQVPQHGFTDAALSQGAREAGYLDVSTNLFPRGIFELIRFHLVRERLQLAEHASQDPESSAAARDRLQILKSLILTRLHRNVATGVLPHWTQAVAIMAQATNIPPSMTELAALSDELCYLSGDASVDLGWYRRRANVAGIYAASELYMTQDQSTEYEDTAQFVEDRLRDVQSVDDIVADVGEWVGFTAWSTLNLLRSRGVRI